MVKGKDYRNNGTIMGKLKFRCNYKNNEKNGLYEEWDKNGHLCVRRNFTNDIGDDLYEDHKNEQECARCNFVKNNFYGAWNNNKLLCIKCKIITNNNKNNLYGQSNNIGLRIRRIHSL